MKKISILHTGGTIASKVDYKTGAVSAKFSERDILKLYPEIKDIAKISSKLITNMSSEDMNFKHYNLLAKEIQKEIKKKSQGIIITHGTDTLHYTSAALSFILENCPIPIILVGAQRSSDRGSSDAALNLICAIQFITKTDFKGTAICMHETTNDTTCSILPSTKTRKFHTSRRDAFKPINSKPIAIVHKHGAINLLQKIKKSNKKLQLKLFNHKIKVAIIKSYPNLLAETIKLFSKYDGLILEGTGLGHFPINKTDNLTTENKKILTELKKLAKKIPIIMTSQCIFGRINLNVYSTGRILKEIGILGDLLDTTTETAYIKLAWLLSNYPKKDIKKLIPKNFRQEISQKTPADFLE